MNKNVWIWIIVIITCSSFITATDLSACGTISSPGNYNLTTNLVASGTCITTNGNSIVLEGNGHSIKGNIVTSTAITLNNIFINGTVSTTGGSVTADNSRIITINADGYNSNSNPGGNGGTVILTNSNVNTITSNGGRGWHGGGGGFPGAYYTSPGGPVIASFSNITTITANGPPVGENLCVPRGVGKAAGSVTLTLFDGVTYIIPIINSINCDGTSVTASITRIPTRPTTGQGAYGLPYDLTFSDQTTTLWNVNGLQDYTACYGNPAKFNYGAYYYTPYNCPYGTWINQFLQRNNYTDLGNKLLGFSTNINWTIQGAWYYNAMLRAYVGDGAYYNYPSDTHISNGCDVSLNTYGDITCSSNGVIVYHTPVNVSAIHDALYQTGNNNLKVYIYNNTFSIYVNNHLVQSVPTTYQTTTNTVYGLISPTYGGAGNTVYFSNFYDQIYYCNPVWVKHGACDGNTTTYQILYTDSENCGSTLNLPANNGTYVTNCRINVPGWNELISGQPVSGAFKALNEPMGGWLIMLLWIILTMIIVSKTGSWELSTIIGLIFLTFFLVTPWFSGAQIGAAVLFVALQLAFTLFRTSSKEQGRYG